MTIFKYLIRQYVMLKHSIELLLWEPKIGDRVRSRRTKQVGTITDIYLHNPLFADKFNIRVMMDGYPRGDTPRYGTGPVRYTRWQLEPTECAKVQ